MTFKSSSELHFVLCPTRAPALEIDADSASDADLMTAMLAVLSRYAVHDSCACATLYVQRTLNLGYDAMTNTDVLVAAGAPDDVLEQVGNALERTAGARVRFASEIDIQDAAQAWHVEAGHVSMSDDDESRFACETTWSGEPWPASLAVESAAPDDADEDDENAGSFQRATGWQELK